MADCDARLWVGIDDLHFGAANALGVSLGRVTMQGPKVTGLAGTSGNQRISASDWSRRETEGTHRPMASCRSSPRSLKVWSRYKRARGRSEPKRVS
jgi:hypothetical protein